MPPVEADEEAIRPGETGSGGTGTNLQGLMVDMLREIIAADVRVATSTASRSPVLYPRQPQASTEGRNGESIVRWS